jgi:hypothetical protein
MEQRSIYLNNLVSKEKQLILIFFISHQDDEKIFYEKRN